MKTLGPSPIIRASPCAKPRPIVMSGPSALELPRIWRRVQLRLPKFELVQEEPWGVSLLCIESIDNDSLEFLINPPNRRHDEAAMIVELLLGHHYVFRDPRSRDLCADWRF